MKKQSGAASGTRVATIGDTRYRMMKVGSHGDNWHITADGHPISGVSDYHTTLKAWDELMRAYKDNPRVRDMGRYVYSWFSADSYLKGRDSAKLGNNTVVKRTEGGRIAVYLHRTPIIEYNLDGVITLRSGGWRTSTTKQRINELMPAGFGLHQAKHEWYVTTPRGQYEFYDGMELQSDGLLVGYKSFEGAGPTFVQSAKHLRENPQWDVGERVEFKGDGRMRLPAHRHLNPPSDDLPASRTEHLEPNWHGMGRWALHGLSTYIDRGKVSGPNRTRLSKDDRKSIIALLATACASAFYVHDIGSELVELVKPPIRDPEWTDAMLEDEAHRLAQLFVQKGTAHWPGVRESIAVASFTGDWGVAANAFSDAIA